MEIDKPCKNMNLIKKVTFSNLNKIITFYIDKDGCNYLTIINYYYNINSNNDNEINNKEMYCNKKNYIFNIINKIRYILFLYINNH
jgi:hypothetical protein